MNKPTRQAGPVLARLDGMTQHHDLEAHIKRLVDQAPPLTPAQRDKLATLLATDSTPATTTNGA